jgi:hypothetical protein
VLDAYQRNASIVPQQALALANSRLAQSAAVKIAARLTGGLGSESPSDSAFVRAAFEAVLANRPTDEERSECEGMLSALAASFRKRGASPADAASRARAALVRALLNHNDFVTIR